MLLDCVITAVNENPLYLDFIPIFIKTWHKLYPNIDVKIILISNSIPTQFQQYENNIILFKPLEGISTAFISQYIRLLYPAILNYQNGIMITDIDILPMNNTYYTQHIKEYSNDKFIYLRNVLLNIKEIAMCYNIATAQTWGTIFNINSLEDINERLITKFYEINYLDGHGNSGWNTDQTDLYNHVINWHNKTNNFIVLTDKQTKFNRLDRSTNIVINDINKFKINKGRYTDYHCLRPFKKYENINNQIVDLL